MSEDDIIYAVLLILGIAFGHFYRKINNAGLKKIVGTVFGLVIIIYTSSLQSLHIFISFTVCCFIIKYDRR